LLREEGSGTADEDRLENLNELEEVVTRFRGVAEFLSFVDQQLARSQSDEPGDRVQLMTIHRSKGLEWPVVFAVGVSEGLLPHRRCMEPAALEEERRLAYVAFTRARDELYVNAVREWQGKYLEPSRFVYEAALMEREVLDYLKATV
jgi:DNA helicase-2/ATP-dependent DNA helicase PcrA